MADLVVKGSELDGLVQALKTAADAMHEATSALAAAGTSGLGHHELDSAADHFSHEWGYGIGQLRKASTNVAEQLADGITFYDGADRQLSDQLRKAVKKS